MGFDIDVSQLSRKLGEADRRRLLAQETAARTAAAQMAADARASAPWRDHTGHARGGITGTSERHDSVITITLSGSVRYLVYLELAHGKKYAILWPTLEKHRDAVLQRIARIGGMR